MKRNLIVALAVAFTAAGCGGDPLSLWKVALIKGAKPASCFKDGRITDTKTETTTVEDYAGTWELYKAANDKYQLRVGNDVYYGAESKGVFEFTGTQTTTVVDKVDSPTVTTISTVEDAIKLTMKGDAFDGTWTHTTTKRCEGTCSPTFTADNPDCAVTDTLRGTKIPFQTFHQE